MAIVGYLMFGSRVRDEITANIFLTKGYPNWLSVFIVVAIAIIPLTKIPLKYAPRTLLPYPESCYILTTLLTVLDP